MAYQTDFIPGLTIDLPTLTPTIRSQAFGGGQAIDHTNFSLVFNQERGFAIYSAYNIDGTTLLKKGPKRAGFTLDPLIPRALQVDNDRGYKGFPNADDNPWDRGHLARRRALHWPNLNTATQADKESSHYTNIVPQHQRINRQGGPWARIENNILDLADQENRRACVFAGPVFTGSDSVIVNKPGELPVKIPVGFWKVVAIPRNTELCVAAFLIWQCDIQTGQPVNYDPVLEQVRVNTVEYLAGLFFDKDIRGADSLRFNGANAACTITDASDIII